MIPEGWTIATLGDVAKILSGGTPDKSNTSYWNGNIPWISAKDLKSFRISDSIDRVTELGAKCGTRLVQTGTILVLVRGMTLLKDVPVGIAQRPLTFNQDVKAIVVKDGCCPEFVAYSLVVRRLSLMSNVDTAGHGTGRLATEFLEAFPLYLPPLAEQQKIAAILSTQDRKIDLHKQKLDALRRQTKGLMQQLLTGKIRVRVEPDGN